MLDSLELIGREEALFTQDVMANQADLLSLVESNSFLVIGGAGSIGQSVVKELFKRNPRVLHVVDISENNMVELVRDIRSSLGYINGDFRLFAIDCGSREFDIFYDHEGPYDYVLNLSAMKHVRSEKDPYTLMRMIRTNVLNIDKVAEFAQVSGAKKYFCVSTDKATNPVNMMGGSKRIMEMFLMRRSSDIPLAMARFANVAFSDGSLLHGFNLRLRKGQPLSAPRDVRRYFISANESGELCLMACLLGENRDIFFPKLSGKLNLMTFADIVQRYLFMMGYEPYICDSEDEARQRVKELSNKNYWPCYLFDSDTTGEKDFEEFYTDKEDIDMDRYHSIGVIRNRPEYSDRKLALFTETIEKILNKGYWTKEEIVTLFEEILPDFRHKETGKYLDDRM